MEHRAAHEIIQDRRRIGDAVSSKLNDQANEDQARTSSGVRTVNTTSQIKCPVRVFCWWIGLMKSADRPRRHGYLPAGHQA